MGGTSAGAEEKLLAVAAGQAALGAHDLQPCQAAQPGLQAGAGLVHALLHALHRGGDVDLDLAHLHAELRRAPRHMGHARRLAQCLRRRGLCANALREWGRGFRRRAPAA
jgi:hypothetical protein